MMMLYLVLLALLASTTLQENCEDIICSNIIDYVCGAIEYKNGSLHIMKYLNICTMRQTSCKLQSIAEVYKASDILCNINKQHVESGRRGTDFSIVGAHQICNHTCPTYCVDTYQPACAQIWKPNMQSSSYRPMINHCHIDLFSCSTGLNVTIHPLGKCYKNPSGLLFMTQVAAMKSLKLLDDGLARGTHHTFIYSGNTRKSYYDLLREILRRKLEK